MKERINLRIILGGLTLSLIAFIWAVAFKSQMPNSGLLEIKTVENAMAFSGGTTSYNARDDSSWTDISIEDYEGSDTILIVEPANDLRQYDYYLRQRVMVKQVIKGQAVTEGQYAYIMDYGFSDDYRGLRFYSQTNVLKPSRQYLVFLQPNNFYNQYQSEDYYMYALYGPPAFDIENEHSGLIEKAEIATSYQEVKDMDYFIAIPEMLSFISDLRARLLERYIN